MFELNCTSVENTKYCVLKKAKLSSNSQGDFIVKTYQKFNENYRISKLKKSVFSPDNPGQKNEVKVRKRKIICFNTQIFSILTSRSIGRTY